MEPQFKFSSDHGELECVRVDMDWVRARVVEWEAENAPPEPPSKEMSPAQFKFKETRKAHLLAQSRGISMDEAEVIVAKEIGTYKDEKDPAHLIAMKQWEWDRYIRTEELMWTNSILFTYTDGERDTLANGGNRRLGGTAVIETMKRIAASEDRFLLHAKIMENSELTWGSVVASARNLGINRHGKPILETIPADGGEAQALAGLGAIAAKDQGMTPTQYKQLPVPEQAAVLAVDLCDRWAKYYAAQDSAEKQKNDRKTHNQTRARGGTR